MKRVLSLLLVLCLLVSCAAAEGVPELPSETPPTSETPAEPVETSPEETPAEPTEASPEEPTEASPETPTDVPADVSTDVPTDAPTDVPADAPTDVPADTPTDVPTDVPTDAPTDVPTDVPTDTPTDVPTDVPADMPTDVPTDVPTDTPTDVPTDVPTDMPTDVPTDVPTDTPTDVPPDVPADTPTDVPTDVPTDTPTDEPAKSPTDEPTDMPTEEPTAEPTEEPAAEPTVAPTEEPTAEPWDESQCQHNTPECELAPKCGTPGCQHITQDVHGLDVPICELGEWLLDAQDASPIMTLSVRADVIDLNLDDAVIYRSGTYQIKGGNLRPGASLRVAKNRVVVLNLENVTVGTVAIAQGGTLYLACTGESRIDKLTLEGDNAVTLNEGGALTIDVYETDPSKETTFEVLGGSLYATLEEKDGRLPYSFDAQGAQSVTVAGEDYLATPHADGRLHLWLPAPEAGMVWTSHLEETTLAVAQEADVQPTDPSAITAGQDNPLRGGQTYELIGELPAGTRLLIAEGGVTVVLRDVRATGVLIDATCAYTLQIAGENVIESLTGGTVTLQGDGKLTVNGSLPAASFLSGRYVLANVPANEVAFTVGYPLADQTVTLDGAPYPLLMNLNGDLLLPTPAAGLTYAITADETTVTVNTVQEGDLAFTLTADAPTADAGAAAGFTVAGDGSAVTGSIAASGATANAAFQNVRVQSDGATLSLAQEHLTVSLTGDNLLQSAAGTAIVLDEGSSLALNTLSGRLVLRGQASLNNITLQGNILVEPDPGLPHTCLFIRDKNGNPVPNREMTVSIGGQTWSYTTHYDGSLHLWGLGDLSGQDIAAADGENVYTAVIVNNQAQLTTGLTDFSPVTFASQSDGSLLISWAVPGAAVTGVQVVYGAEAVDMPDAYMAGALHLLPTGDFSVRLTDIPAGSVVTVRVYATAAAGAEFNEQTDDGFQFGEIYTHVHRLPWVYKGEAHDADKLYTGQAYRPSIQLPENASVTYSGKDLVNGRPVAVGDYVMHVTIPDGDPVYQPGTVDIPFAITKLQAVITPGYNLQKYKYRDDPEFTWTVSGLLEGDTVTGVLTREPGEEAGEYAWLTDGFSAPDYYELCIDPEAAPFMILPLAPLGGILVDEIMNPVQQTIVLKDGRRLIVTLTAQESLTVTNSVLGNLVRNEKNEPQLSTPQLSWNPETDEVLLMLRAEADMNIDHGYQTDSMGNPIWGVRRLRMGWTGLNHMKKMGIAAVSLNNNGASLVCRVDDFLTPEMEEFIKEAGGSPDSAIFWATVAPEQTLPEGVNPVTAGWRMGVTVQLGSKETDVTALLPNLTAVVDMEPVAELLTQLARYDEEAFPTQFALTSGQTALTSSFVTPFEEDELTLAAFPGMMTIDRYLSAPLTAPGIVCAVNAPPQPIEAAELADAVE